MAGTKEDFQEVMLSMDEQHKVRKVWFDYIKEQKTLHPEMCPGVWSDIVGCLNTLDSAFKLCTWASAVMTFPHNAAALGFQEQGSCLQMPDCNFDGCAWNHRGIPGAVEIDSVQEIMASEGTGTPVQAKWSPQYPVVKADKVKNTQDSANKLAQDRILSSALTQEELGHLLWAMQSDTDRTAGSQVQPDRKRAGLIIPPSLDAPGNMQMSETASSWKKSYADKTHYQWHQQITDHMIDDPQSLRAYTVDKFWSVMVAQQLSTRPGGKVSSLLKVPKKKATVMKKEGADLAGSGPNECKVVEDINESTQCFCAIVGSRKKGDSPTEAWTGLADSCKCPW